MIMKIIRAIVSPIILAIDFLTRPTPMKRSSEEQAKVDEAASYLQLYQFNACPFCMKVRRHARKLNVPLTLKDAKNDPDIKKELLEQGGSPKVPCLKIEENGKFSWMYESKVINQYLTDHFAAATT